MTKPLALLLIVAAVATRVPTQDAAPYLVVEFGPPSTARLRTPKGETRVLQSRSNAVVIAENTADFASPQAHMDFGPDRGLCFSSDTSFAIDLTIRAQPGGFSTPLICRQHNAVNYAFAIGRSPGTISFELWDWKRSRAISSTRIDDGAWHHVHAAFLAPSRTAVLILDGVIESVVPVGGSFTPPESPELRLGNNTDWNQPFAGQLRDVRIVEPRVPSEALELMATTRLLDPVAVEGNLVRWLTRHREPRPPSAESPDAWPEVVAASRARLQDALGLWPPPYAPGNSRRLAGRPTPLSGGPTEATSFVHYQPALDLEIREGGRLDRDGYTVRRLYWQTMRGYWAAGYLYRPTGTPPGEKIPAVLCPHGHFRRGNRHSVVQARCITLARLGYVVLTVDSAHVYDDPIGLSPLSLMTWNNLRALELLRGLPDVDPDRIGCTGASGGAQQTMYLTGLDSGLAAAAPAAMVCYYEEILLPTGVHCHCNFTPRVMTFIDQPGMSAAFAPRPQLFLSVTRDWTANFPARGFPEIRILYEMLGQPDNVGSQQWDLEHGYDRPMRNAMYAFFERTLGGVTDPSPELESPGIATETHETLAALDRTDVPRDHAAVIREFRERLRATPLAPEEVAWDGAVDLIAARRAHLARLLDAPEQPPPTAREERTLEWRGHEARMLAIAVEPEVSVPVLLFEPPARGEPRRLALLIGTCGKAMVLASHQEWVETLLKRGYTVALADVRYTGELDVARPWRDPYGKIFGQDEGTLAVRDTRAVVDALSKLPGERADGVALIAFGDHGAAALYAAALDEGISHVVAHRLGAPYEQRDRRPKIVRVLRHGDLPDAACLIAPRTFVAGGAAPAPYEAAQRRYAELDAVDNLILRTATIDLQTALDAIDR